MSLTFSSSIINLKVLFGVFFNRLHLPYMFEIIRAVLFFVFVEATFPGVLEALNGMKDMIFRRSRSLIRRNSPQENVHAIF